MRLVIYLLTACILFMNNAYAASDEVYCEKITPYWRVVLTLTWRPEKKCLLVFAERHEDKTRVEYGCWGEVLGDIHVLFDYGDRIFVDKRSEYVCTDPNGRRK